MAATVAVTALTVLLSGVFFTFKVSRLLSVVPSGEDSLTYRVDGQVFFASADMLVDAVEVVGMNARSRALASKLDLDVSWN